MMKKIEKAFNFITFDASKMLLFIIGFATIVCASYIHLDIICIFDINQLSIIKFSHLANSILKIVYGLLHDSCHKYHHQHHS